jgi:hypothetical protein
LAPLKYLPLKEAPNVLGKCALAYTQFSKHRSANYGSLVVYTKVLILKIKTVIKT